MRPNWWRVSLCLLCAAATCAAQQDRSTPTLKMEQVAPPVGAPAIAGRPAGQSAQLYESERDWRARLSAAQGQSRLLDRQARQAELEVESARRAFYGSAAKSGRDAAADNARFAVLHEMARVAIAAADLARAEVSRLLEEGKRRGYEAAPPEPPTPEPPRVETAQSDEASFRARFLRLKRRLDEAEERAAVLRLRADRLQALIRQPFGPIYRTRPALDPYSGAQSGVFTIDAVPTSDPAYLDNLRLELELVQGGLQATLARAAALTREIEELREEGRVAGALPGTFR
jgi:hypothetical protein